MRWREVKKGKKKQPNNFANSLKTSSKKAPFYLSQRIVAFITDMFMINMPILYITTYVVLGSKEEFLGNQWAIFICVLIFGVTLSFLFSYSGQSLGYRYVRLRLVRDIAKVSLDSKKALALNEEQAKATQMADTANQHLQNPPFIIALLRYVLWIVSVASIFGILVAYFRADSKALYDIVCRTKVVAINEPQNPKIIIDS